MSRHREDWVMSLTQKGDGPQNAEVALAMVHEQGAPTVPRPAANHRLNWADRQAGYIHPCIYCWGHGIQLRAHTACASGNEISESTSRLRRGDTLPARPTSWWCEQQTNMLEINPVAWDKQWTVTKSENIKKKIWHTSLWQVVLSKAGQHKFCGEKFIQHCLVKNVSILPDGMFMCKCEEWILWVNKIF